MAYTPHRIANEFLSLAEAEKRPLSNMQLQKLVFLAHGFALAVLHEPLSRQEAHAFDWGPVFPKLYKALKKFGSGAVSERLPVPPEESGPLVEQAHKIVEAVWKAFGHQPASKLSALTHQPGAPWTEIYSVSKYGVIPNDRIEAYYRERLNVETSPVAAAEAADAGTI